MKGRKRTFLDIGIMTCLARFVLHHPGQTATLVTFFSTSANSFTNSPFISLVSQYPLGAYDGRLIASGSVFRPLNTSILSMSTTPDDINPDDTTTILLFFVLCNALVSSLTSKKCPRWLTPKCI